MSIDFLKPYWGDSKIRVGRLKDGGYVVEKNSLSAVDVTYSYGVGWEVSFEKDMYLNTKHICRLFDPTMIDVSNLKRFWRQGLFYFVKYIAKAVLWYPYLISLKVRG